MSEDKVSDVEEKDPVNAEVNAETDTSLSASRIVKDRSENAYASMGYFDLCNTAGQRGYALKRLPYIETPEARQELIDWLVAYDLKESGLLQEVNASNGVDVVVSGSVLVIRSPRFQQDAKVAVLTHPQAHTIIQALIAVHGNPITQAAASPKAGLSTMLPADCPASSPESVSESVSSDTPASPEKLKRVLTDCHAAIASLPEDALGRHPELGYPYRDELFSKIEQVLNGEVE